MKKRTSHQSHDSKMSDMQRDNSRPLCAQQPGNYVCKCECEFGCECKCECECKQDSNVGWVMPKLTGRFTLRLAHTHKPFLVSTP